jgi:hypothetical protein
VANSTRMQIMDAITSVLQAIDGTGNYVATVTTISEDTPEHPSAYHTGKFPLCFPIDTNETREPWAIGASTNDTKATLNVVITSMVYSKSDATRQQRNDLIRDVERAMFAGTTLASLVLDITPTRVVTDGGTIKNFSVWDQEFEVEYIYKSTTGG